MKRKLLIVFAILLVIFAFTTTAGAAKNNECSTITSGEILYSAGHYLAGQAIPTGFDAYGYNYQGHYFKGSYANVYLGGDGYPPYMGDDEAYLAENPGAASHWAWPYREIRLLMKWNDAWISNKDCDSDGKLDRHYGYPSYIGSGAWETNHMYGDDLIDGKLCTWNDFVKIVAVPADAVKTDGAWYTADGTEIGPVIWGEFATIQEVYNNPCFGEHGLYYISPANAGLGGW